MPFTPKSVVTLTRLGNLAGGRPFYSATKSRISGDDGSVVDARAADFDEFGVVLLARRQHGADQVSDWCAVLVNSDEFVVGNRATLQEYGLAPSQQARR